MQRQGIDAARGLTAALIRERLAEHGANTLPEAPPHPLWRTLAHQFKSPLIYILFVAVLRQLSALHARVVRDGQEALLAASELVPGDVSAAKIVVTDDNFATIVGAVEQGLVVYGNLKKVILSLFAISIDDVVVLMLALLGGYPQPMAAVQMLWINIVTEGRLTVNPVMDPPDGDEMQRAPVPRDDALVDRSMIGRLLLMATLAVVATFGSSTPCH